MQNKLQNKVKALIATFAGIAMVLSLVAVSTAEAAFTRDLSVGSSGPDVSELQSALVAGGYLVMPAGVAMGTFGPLTQAAVAKWQAAVGITPAVGYFGPISKARLMAGGSSSGSGSTVGLCPNGRTLVSNCTLLPAGSPGPLCPNGNTIASNCTSGGSSSNDNTLSGGETDINNINFDDADDDTINEGSNESPVAQLEFDVDDADAEFVRADIVFQAADSADESDPWQVFDNVYLMDGSDVIAEVSSDDEDMWDDADNIIAGTPINQASRIRFNNIGQDYQEGDTASLWVAVDVASGVDGADTGDADWTVGIDELGLRFTDGAGLDTEVDTADLATFSIEEAGAQSDFDVSKASDSPGPETLEVKETTTTTHTVAIFKASADEDGNDVKINDFPITLTIAATGTGDDMTEVVDDVFVVIDGTEYSADQAPDDLDPSQTFTFEDIDDDDVIVTAGEDMDVEVKVKFRSQGILGANYANGSTIVASAALANNDVEDPDSGDDIDSGIDGSATGETMTLAGSGIMVDVTSATTDITEIDGVTNDTASFVFLLDISAFGDDDVYINRDSVDIAITGSTTEATDVNTFYTIEVSTGATLASQSGTIADTSDAEEVTADATAYVGAYAGETFFKIENGETESFRVTVSGTNQTDNKQVRAFLSSLEFTTDNVEALTAEDATVATFSSYSANLAEDSQTPFKPIQ